MFLFYSKPAYTHALLRLYVCIF